MLALAHLLRLSGFAKGKCRSHGRLDKRFVNDLGDLGEFVAIGSAHDMLCAHAVGFRRSCLNIGDSCDQESAGLQDSPGSIKGIFANGVTTTSASCITSSNF